MQVLRKIVYLLENRIFEYGKLEKRVSFLIN